MCSSDLVWLFSHHSQRSYKGIVHEVTNVIHRQLQAVEQFFLASLHWRTTPEEVSKSLTIRQGEKETLRSYVKHFTRETLEVDEADDKVQLTTFKAELKSKEFKVSLAKNPPKMMTEMLLKA